MRPCGPATCADSARGGELVERERPEGASQDVEHARRMSACSRGSRPRSRQACRCACNHSVKYRSSPPCTSESCSAFRNPPGLIASANSPTNRVASGSQKVSVSTGGARGEAGATSWLLEEHD